MKIIRYEANGAAVYASVEGDRAYPLRDAPWVTRELQREGTSVALAGLKVLPPCVPSKIVGVGKNYRSRLNEMQLEAGDPLLFLKAPTTIVGPGDAIKRPRRFERFEFEAELAVVIGRPASRVPRDQALSYVFGYTCFNDVTVRDVIKKDVQLTRAKNFDTSGPMGPAIVTDLDPQSLTVIARSAGEVLQNGNVSDMMFDIPTLIAFITDVMTLLPGDVIATGTPSGSRNLSVGETIEIEIPGIGVLSNPVVAADEG